VGTGLSNYNISYVNGTLTVNTKALTITANNRSKTYGDTVTFAGTEFTAVGLVNADTVTSVTLVSAGSGAGATVSGSPYAITPSAAVGTGLSNYNISYVNGSLTVNLKALTVTANNRSKTYGDTVTFAGTEFTAVGLVNADTVTSVTLVSAGSGAGATVSGSPYAITPSAAVGTGLSNYNISYVNGTLTVNTKALTITANNRSKTYGDTVTFAGTEFVATGLVNGDTVTSVTLTSSGTAAGAAVGTYNIVPSAAVGTGLSNYNISYVNGSLTVNLKALTVTANNRSKTYGDTVTFAGTEFTAVGLVNADTVTSVTLVSAGSGAGATVSGSPYAITPSAAVGTGLSNYNISYVNGTLTVNPKALDITANDLSKTVGDTLTFSGTEFSAPGLVNSDTVDGVTLTSSGAAAGAAVGTYDIVASAAIGTGLSNYNISYVNGSLTVNLRTLTITANDRSKTYGDTVTFAGTEFTIVGLIDGDTVTGVTLTSAGSGASATVGSYSIIPSAAVGNGLSNYNISYVNGNLTVNPKALTITANDRGKTYGDTLIFAGTEFVATGLVNGDTVTSVTLVSAGVAGGATVSGSPYAMTPGAAVGTGMANYNISYVDGTLTVVPKALTITANSRVKTYGDTLTFAGTEFSTSGLLNADTVTSVTLTSSGAAAGAQLGTYDIVPGAAVGVGLPNYTVTYFNGTVTVGPKALTITANDLGKTYGDTFAFDGTEFLAIGLVNPDTVTSITLTSTGAGATAAAGAHAIVPSVATGTGLSNYSISYVEGTLTVSPKVLTITANSQTKTYGDTAAFAGTEFTAAGLVNADAITGVTLSSTGAGATAPAGTHAVIPSAAVGTRLSNYDISYVGGTLTVNPKDLTIIASNRSKTYGDTVTFAGTEFTAVGLVNADTVTSVTLASSGTAADAVLGVYGIVPSAALGSGLGNYGISYIYGQLSIVKGIIVWAIDSSPEKPTYGDAVTFTASVTGTGATAATGTVTFKDGGVTLGSATLTDGSAVYTASTLSAGSHYITVTYDGGANFDGSASLAHICTVKAPAKVNLALLAEIIAAGGVAMLLLLVLILRRKRGRVQQA
ncbi:MAG: Ig-like domain repeat protein, partial [Chloroflexi bacterium]|nr:Ig-like domain repeat protein [Chloroflexota bacterium]